MAVLQPEVRLFIELSTTRVFVWLSLIAGGGGDVGLALISTLRVRSGLCLTTTWVRFRGASGLWDNTERGAFGFVIEPRACLVWVAARKPRGECASGWVHSRKGVVGLFGLSNSRGGCKLVGCRDSRGEGLSGRVATKEAGVSGWLSTAGDSRGMWGCVRLSKQSGYALGCGSTATGVCASGGGVRRVAAGAAEDLGPVGGLARIGAWLV
ncbi:hypothetical protein Tco_1522037 [Tanacetum coccineum]